MPIPFPFDFKHPDYLEVFEWRADRLRKLRSDPDNINILKNHYKNDPAQFIIDWGCTYDPRHVAIGLPAIVPFILFPKQEEWVHWLMDHWRTRRPGITEKSRDMGLSWLSCAVAATLCLFHDNLNIGFGSRKEEYVDRNDDPKSLFYKIREFVSMLPVEFRKGWDRKRDAPFMRIKFPTSSIITGEAGDSIGRGDRTSIEFLDESAHLSRPHLIEASLSATTDCRIDISTPNGMNNPFARKRFSKEIDVFTFHWRDDPRRDEEWYIKKCKDIADPVVIAQELDLDYAASIEGVLIPSAWVQSAVDAHVKLKIDITGIKKAGLDVADEGRDKNAICFRHGILADRIESWSGVGGDIYKTVERALLLCKTKAYELLDYDADGLGAGVRGDAKNIVERMKYKIYVSPFRGSGSVVDPEKEMIPGRLNKDFFANAKAQAWWSLRARFQETHRAVVHGLEYDPTKIISISSYNLEISKLIVELSQPTFRTNDAGQIIINKSPENSMSPNLADSLMIAFAPIKRIPKGFFSG